MLTDGIQLIDGAVADNLQIQSGTSLPSTGTNLGELFYLTTGNAGVYIFDGTQWVGVSAAEVSFDSLNVKQAVRAATVTSITLSGPQTIDGVSVIAGDRVLVKNQATLSQNGIYVVNAGGWSRATDFDGSPTNEVRAGDFCFVSEGTTNGDTGWVLTTNGTITVGTTSLTFAQFTGTAATPGGTSGQVQYNSSGTFAGSTKLTYTDAQAKLTVGEPGGSVSGKITSGAGVGIEIYPETMVSLNPGNNVTITGGQSNRAGGSVVLTGGQENTVGYGGGNVSLNGGAGAGGTGYAGSVYLSGGVGTAQQGSLYFNTASVNRLVIQGNGAWALGSGLLTGSAGQVLTSNGSSAAPTWQNASGGAPGGADTNVQYNSGGSFAGTSSFIYNSASNGMVLSAADVSSAVSVQNTSSSTARFPGFTATNYAGSSGGFAALNLRTSRGTGASPVALNANDIITSIKAWGHDGSSFVDTAAMEFYAESGFSGSIRNTYIAWLTRSGSGALTERMRLNSGGALGFGGANYGTAGQVLTSNGSSATPTWQAVSAGAANTLNGTAAYSLSPQTTTGVYAGTSGSVPRVFFTHLSAATGKRNSQVYNDGTNLVWTFINDGNTAETAWLTVALPTNNASQLTPGITLNSTVLSFGNGTAQVTPATGISTGAVSSWLTTANIAGAATNNMLLMPGQNTNTTGAAATTYIMGALRNNSGAAGDAYFLGGQNTATGTAGHAYVSGGNQTGSSTGVGGTLSLYGGAGGSSGSGGPITIYTAPANTHIERLRILANGAWSVGTGGTATGTAGQVLTSNGSGAAPTWQAPGGSLTSTYVGYGNGSNALTGTANFTFDNTNGSLSIASTTTVAQRGIVVHQNDATIAGASMLARKSRGSLASPTTIVSGDYIFSFNAAPYTSTSGYVRSGAFGFKSLGAVTGTSAPGEWYFSASTGGEDSDPYGNGTVKLKISATNGVEVTSQLTLSGTAGTSGQVLTSNGTGNVPTWQTFSGVSLNQNNSFTKAQTVTPVALTDGATINVDASLSNNFKVTLAGNRALANPTNMLDGQIINIRVVQDGTGGRTLTYGSKYRFPGGEAPTLSTGANAVDLLTGVYYSDLDIILCQMNRNFF